MRRATRVRWAANANVAPPIVETCRCSVADAVDVVLSVATEPVGAIRQRDASGLGSRTHGDPDLASGALRRADLEVEHARVGVLGPLDGHRSEGCRNLALGPPDIDRLRFHLERLVARIDLQAPQPSVLVLKFWVC
jgi:hypothetical protein